MLVVSRFGFLLLRAIGLVNTLKVRILALYLKELNIFFENVVL